MIDILKRISRPALIFLVVIAAAALFRAGAGPTSVAAENRISLDAGVSADAFNGRPVLVTFFASC